MLLIDDGIASGSTMNAGVLALRTRNPAKIVVAAPVGSPSACDMLSDVADEVVCLRTPDPFYAVGTWYEDFTQTEDEEIQALLERAAGFDLAEPALT